MSRSIAVVIGNGFGDEGKGHMVDYLASHVADPLVVRFSGGAQAGHTVVTPEGKRHVFHHVGSGAMAGAPTFLSRYFATDPFYFLREFAQLAQLSESGTPVTFDITVDPMSPVVTPWDVLLNQLVEVRRGSARHGSCGFGFGEAMKREEETTAKLRVQDLIGPRWLLEAKLQCVREHFLREVEARNLGFGSHEPFEADFSKCDDQFWSSVPQFLELVDIDTLPRGLDLIFEGSQGLLLDRDMGTFPHVTRSKTGLINVEKLLGAEFSGAEVYFVSRAYMTRHGSGPLPGEDSRLKYEDPTNAPNEWQGTLRFAPYNHELLTWARQYATAEVGSFKRGHIVTTCLDQIPEDMHASHLAQSRFVSYGPTRNDFEKSTTR